MSSGCVGIGTDSVPKVPLPSFLSSVQEGVLQGHAELGRYAVGIRFTSQSGSAEAMSWRKTIRQDLYCTCCMWFHYQSTYMHVGLCMSTRDGLRMSLCAYGTLSLVGIKGAFSQRSFGEAGDCCTGGPSMLSHHYVQQTVVFGTLSLSAPVSAHQPKKRSFAVTESWSQLETMTWLAQEGMASKPASLLTKHGLVSRCKNPRIAVMSGVQSFLLRRPEFVQSCWHCNGFPPETVTDSQRVASRYVSR